MRKFLGILSVFIMVLMLASCGSDNNASANVNTGSNNSINNVDETDDAEEEKKEETKLSDITGTYNRFSQDNITIKITETEFILNGKEKTYTYSYIRIAENIIYVDGQYRYYLIINGCIFKLPDDTIMYSK